MARRLEGLQENPFGAGVEALAGQFKGLYRVHVGTYRVMFALDYGGRRVTNMHGRCCRCGWASPCQRAAKGRSP